MTPASPEALLAAYVKRVAKGLTKAQREALLTAEARPHAIGGGDRWTCRNANRVAASLYAKKLAYPAIPMIAWRSSMRDVCLIPLGLAVRHYLSADNS